MNHWCHKYNCSARKRVGLDFCIAYDCPRHRPGHLNERGLRGMLNAVAAWLRAKLKGGR